MVGMLAMSKAGHDKGTIYVIIREEDEYVYVADGRIRTADRCKKKNKKHIQLIKINDRCTDIPSMTNERIKYIIKQYCRDIKVTV